LGARHFPPYFATAAANSSGLSDNGRTPAASRSHFNN
jgi:hypothetical protein